MKAAVYQSLTATVAIEARAEPEPAPDEVVLRVERCGICGTDLHITSGHAGSLPDGSLFGHEFSGEVVRAGRDVLRFKSGDRVAAMPVAGCGTCAACHAALPVYCPQSRNQAAGFAEFITVAESSCIKLPRTLSFADGALVEPLSVGLHGVGLSQMTAGSRVLILGAGSVGLAATFWARQLGAGPLVSASPSVRRAALAEEIGADSFVTLGDDNAGRIAEALGGPPDVVFECAGSVGATGMALDLVRPRGKVISLGFCSDPDPIIPALATFKQASIQFSMLYTLTEFEHCARVLDSGEIAPRAMISRTVPLNELPDTLAGLRSGSSDTKVQVAPLH